MKNKLTPEHFAQCVKRIEASGWNMELTSRLESAMLFTLVQHLASGGLSNPKGCAVEALKVLSLRNGRPEDAWESKWRKEPGTGPKVTMEQEETDDEYPNE